MNKRTLVMVVLDGWGIGRKDASNPIHIAQPKNIDYIKHHYLAGTIQASGIAVGLPWGEEGNSEVGHLTLGAGKIIYQHFPRISMAVHDGSFFKNEALLTAIRHAKENGGSVNLAGLLTEGNVHASIQHLQALIKMATAEIGSKERVKLHLFTDGRDSGPKSAIDLLQALGDVNVASLSGRFFAMDRTLHWDRTQASHDAMTGKSKPVSVSAIEMLKTFYERGLTDEFIEPGLLYPDGAVKDNDSLIFFDFREDSVRQIVQLFIKTELKNLHICTFTKYSDKFDLPVAFPPEKIINPLGRVLSENGRIQLRLAEDEKYAHITYFFNGLQEPPFKNEYRVLVPSRNVPHHDEFPEMMAGEITARAISAMNDGVYDFILINYANGDMVAHTGNFEAAITAIKAVDAQIGELIKKVIDKDGVLLITADHGNVERMFDPRTGLTETKHDTNPVPIYIVGRGYESDKDDFEIARIEKESIGVLSDVAPTVLGIMGLRQPPEMTGVSLVGIMK